MDKAGPGRGYINGIHHQQGKAGVSCEPNAADSPAYTVKLRRVLWYTVAPYLENMARVGGEEPVQQVAFLQEECVRHRETQVPQALHHPPRQRRRYGQRLAVNLPIFIHRPLSAHYRLVCRPLCLSRQSSTLPRCCVCQLQPTTLFPVSSAVAPRFLCLFGTWTRLFVSNLAEDASHMVSCIVGISDVQHDWGRGCP